MSLADLAAPTRPDEIEWRIQSSGIGNKGPWAKIVPYVQNRAIMQRLDDCVGPANWANEFREWEGGQLCGISIYIEERGINGWITKWDGAPNTQIEPLKGGLSDSMKRAAVQWGIGRDLYEYGETWADCSMDQRAGYRYAKTKDGVLYWKAPSGGSTSPQEPRGQSQAPSAQDDKAVAAAARATFCKGIEKAGGNAHRAEQHVLNAIREATGMDTLMAAEVTAGQWLAAAKKMESILVATQEEGDRG